MLKDSKIVYIVPDFSNVQRKKILGELYIEMKFIKLLVTTESMHTKKFTFKLMKGNYDFGER